MTRRTASLVLGAALAGTYVWQMAEAALAGEELRWLHMLGLTLALAFVALHLRAPRDGG